MLLWSCRAGEEVTISYGGWPNEVFYLFWGFVPKDNPFDRAVLYSNLQQMIDHLESLQACPLNVLALLSKRHLAEEAGRFLAVGGVHEQSKPLKAMLNLPTL